MQRENEVASKIKRFEEGRCLCHHQLFLHFVTQHRIAKVFRLMERVLVLILFFFGGGGARPEFSLRFKASVANDEIPIFPASICAPLFDWPSCGRHHRRYDDDPTRAGSPFDIMKRTP